MNPLVVLTCVFAAACAAPADYAAPAAVGLAHAAPVATAAVPAPYITEQVVGAPVTHIEQAPAIVNKKLHFGKTQFVSGYSTGILKPAIPDFNIAVPTVLKGSVAYNAPLVKTVKETHVVNEPVPVERRVEVPYDVPVPRTVIEEIPVPYHVDRPYAVPQPVPVAGEPIVNVRRGPAVVHKTHTAVAAAPQVLATPVEAVGYAAAAPAVAVAGPAPAAVGYAAAAPAPVLGYHAAPAVAAVAKEY